MESSGKNAEIHMKHNNNIASPWQKVLAFKVTTITSKIEEICKELGKWNWTGKFETGGNQPYAKLTEPKYLSVPIIEIEILDLLIESESLSLSFSQVTIYQYRLEMFLNEIKTLNIDGIEDEIMNLVCNSRKPSEVDDSLSPSTQIWLDEIFTTIVGGLVQELPRISSLRVTLSKWSTRLSVFNEAFNFIGKHNNSVKALSSASSDQLGTALFIHEGPSLDHRVSKSITESSKHLDVMLDLLVGNEDRLPENWLRKFEVVEEIYIQLHQFLYLRYKRPELTYQPLKKCNGPSARKAAELADNTETMRKKSPEDEITEPIKNSCETSDVTEFVRNAKQSTSCTTHSLTDQNCKSPKLSCVSEDLIYNRGSKNPDIPNDAINSYEYMAMPFFTNSVAPQCNSPRDDKIQALDQLAADAEKFVHIRKDIGEDPAQLPVDLSSDTVYSSPIAGSPFSSNATRSISETALQFKAESSSPYDQKPPCTHYISRYRVSRMPAPSLHSIICKSRKKEYPPDNFRSRYSATDEENMIAYKELSVEDKISKHIGDILRSLPPDAQLKGDNVTDNSHQVDITQTKNPRSLSACVINPCKISTVAGASNSIARSCKADNSTAERDVKIYHLSWTDQEQPTKLLLRLVGEHGERVMVRVGGGWADLGVYLRQHAGIYSRRAVSDSKIEIHGVPTLRTPSVVLKSSPLVPPTLHEWPSSRNDGYFPAETCVAKCPVSDKFNMSKSRQTNDVSNLSTVHKRESKVRPVRVISMPQGESSPVTPTTPSPTASNLGSSPPETWFDDKLWLAGSEPKEHELLDKENLSVDRIDGKARDVSMSIADMPIFGDLGLVGKTRRVWAKRCADEVTT